MPKWLSVARQTGRTRSLMSGAVGRGCHGVLWETPRVRVQEAWGRLMLEGFFSWILGVRLGIVALSNNVWRHLKSGLR